MVDGGKGPIGNELYRTLWQFAERYAGDDLGYDVCLRVVERVVAVSFPWPPVSSALVE